MVGVTPSALDSMVVEEQMSAVGQPRDTAEVTGELVRRMVSGLLSRESE